MDPKASIFVAGHAGLVGSAITRRLIAAGAENVVTKSHLELDLADQRAVEEFFADIKPAYVFLAAAKVGGIHANSTYPADFIRDNLAIQTSVIHSAWKHGVRKLLFLGSSCIYPRDCPQPIKEEFLLSGPLEPSNEWYSIAKIAGLKMCQAYRRQYGFDAICVMPTNLYGPGDNFHSTNSHVLPALMRRIHEAKLRQDESVSIWGSGIPLREFLHVDDMASAAVFLMENYSGEDIVNVGAGTELSIMELARLISDVVGYQGSIVSDPSKSDGTPRKTLDVTRLRAMGWDAQIGLREGISSTYASFVSALGTPDVAKLA